MSTTCKSTEVVFVSKMYDLGYEFQFHNNRDENGMDNIQLDPCSYSNLSKY